MTTLDTTTREWDVRIQRRELDSLDGDTYCLDGVTYAPPEGHDRRELERLLRSMGFTERCLSETNWEEWELWITTSRRPSIREIHVESLLVLRFPEDYSVGECMSLLEEKGFTRTDNRQDHELGPLGGGGSEG